MSDQQKTPLPGEWWETRGGVRAKVTGRTHDRGLAVNYGKREAKLTVWENGKMFIDQNMTHACDLTRHLPACTGWHWEEPKDE